MEKVSSDDDEEHIARTRGLLHSRSSIKRPTTSSPIHKTYSRSRVSSGPSDAGMRKRVKFSVSSTICEAEPLRNGPLLHQNEGTHLVCIDGAKTSEFKSFKRLLEKTTHKLSFDKVVESDIKLKKCKAATSNAIQRKSDVRSSSLPAQYGSSILQCLSSSPALVSQKQEFKNNAEGNNGAARSLLHPSPLIVGKSCGGEHSVTGNMQQHEGTFSGKRARLLQLAARLQNVDDFLSNRSDFILEILQRMGIRRSTKKNEKLQIAEQKMGVLQFPAPSNRRSNHIVEFCDDYSQENLPTYETEQQYASLLALKLDDTETQALPYNHSLKACSTLLPDFDEASPAIELVEEFDCKRCRDDISEVNVFPTDHGNYMRQSYKNLLHFNSIFDHKEQFDLCFTKLEEEDCSSHGALGRNHGSYQADCILFNNCNSENFFRGKPAFSFAGVE